MNSKLLATSLLLAFSLFVTGEALAKADFTPEQLAKARKTASQQNPPVDFDNLMSEADKLGVKCTGDLTRKERIIICGQKVENAKIKANTEEKARFYNRRHAIFELRIFIERYPEEINNPLFKQIIHETIHGISKMDSNYIEKIKLLEKIGEILDLESDPSSLKDYLKKTIEDIEHIEETKKAIERFEIEEKENEWKEKREEKLRKIRRR